MKHQNTVFPLSSKNRLTLPESVVTIPHDALTIPHDTVTDPRDAVTAPEGVVTMSDDHHMSTITSIYDTVTSVT